MSQQRGSLIRTKSKHLAYNSSTVQPNILQENQLLVFEEAVEHTVVVEDSHSLVEEGTLVEDSLVKGNLVEDKRLFEDTLQLKKLKIQIYRFNTKNMTLILYTQTFFFRGFDSTDGSMLQRFRVFGKKNTISKA